MSIRPGEDDSVLDTTLPVRQAANQKPSTRDEFLSLLGKAIDQQVHDIFIEPGDKSGEVSFRTDGHLSTHKQITRERAQQYINLLADASSIPPHRLRQQPATGKILIRHRGNQREARVAFIETVFGVTADIRLSTRTPLTLDELGFEPEQLQAIKQTLASKQGLVVIAGPTTSGKSATGEALLRYVEGTRKLKVFEIADVVEFQNPARSQIVVSKDITWRGALGAALDFRADVIYAGDVRTTEQAKMVADAALRCPLVICTLHAKDAAQVINRLQRMEVEDYQLSAALILIIAQELRRKPCPKCRTNGGRQMGQGCNACGGAGYSGLTLVSEVLPISTEISTQLERHAGGDRIMKHATTKDGVLPMQEVERRKAAAGLIEPRPTATSDETGDTTAQPNA